MSTHVDSYRMLKAGGAKVQKAIRDYENDMAEAKDEGRAEGEINAYVNLVRKGLLKPEIAAQQSNMNLDDFNKLL
jgi:hypothetical protein